MYKAKIGLYLLAFSLPIIGFEISILSFDLPLVDFIALALLLASCFKIIYLLLFSQERLKEFKLPLFFPFFLFLFSSLISSIFSLDQFYSLWYFFRWPLFLYLAYIICPYNLIRDKHTLKRMIIVTASSSFLVLLFGFLSLFSQSLGDSFFRINSLSIFSVFPFGENHNLIAEFLNVGAFFVLSLRFLAKDDRVKRFLEIIFLFFVLGIILTFSRTGWIVLFFQLGLYLFVVFKNLRVKKDLNIRSLIILTIVFLILLSPLFLRMSRLQKDNVSSTENRLLLTEISLKAFKEKPVIGYGSGYFIRLVDDNIRFKAKYGEPIDSHGVWQKVLAENGVFGFFSWLFILLYILKIFYKAIKEHHQKNPWLLPLIIGALGGLIFQFLNTSYYKGKVWLPIVLVLLAIKLVENDYEKKAGKKD